MSKQVKKVLEPELRFPEFRNTGDWEKKCLAEVCEKKSSNISANTLSTKGGRYKIYGASGYLQNISFYKEEQPYIAVVKDGSGVGRSFLCEKKSSVLGTLQIIKPKIKNDLVFVWALIRKIVFNKYVAGGAIPHIYFKDYSKENVAIPLPKEQQKIADCLSSIDELITAHTQKHDALKAHKKGLMQQLFPAVGETVPKLRFPEFRDAGEWEEYSVNQLVAENVLYAPKDGNHGNIHPKSSDYIDYGIPFIMANDIRNGKINYSKCSHLSKEQADSLQKGFAKEGDVLLTHKGTVGEVVVIKTIEFPYLMLTPQVTYYRIKNKKHLLNEFLAACFISDGFQRNLLVVSGGGTRAYIGITEQGKLKIIIPSQIQEQQKIADFLSFLDEIITAQAQKIESLKTHKKGLMQQLFPATDDGCIGAGNRATQDAKAEIGT